MGEEEDPQRIKRIAAAAYDYDNDPQWAEYWSNILIPPHMASRSDVIDRFKRKFYQRYIDPDLVVDAMSSTSSSQSSRASARSASPAAGEQTRPHNSGSRTDTSAPPGMNANSMQWDRQTIQFSVNAWVFLAAMLLKIMYHAPATAGHRSVWAKIGGIVNPYIYCYAPFLSTPISAIQRWWFR